MMLSCDDADLGCEQWGKLLFLKLDPTLRKLLAVLQEHYETLEGKPCHNDCRKDGSMSSSSLPRTFEHEENFLGFLLAEIDLLNDVQKILEDVSSNPIVGEKIWSVSLSNRHLACSIAVLMDYISLPLVAILRRPVTESFIHTEKDEERNHSGADGARRRLHIRQSAERKRIAVAAETLKICLELMNGGGACHEHSLPASMPLSQSEMVRLVLACSSALPTGRSIAKQSTCPYYVRGLDRGEHYIESLLEVLACLLHQVIHTASIASETKQTGNFGNELAIAVDRSLLAHLADVLLSVVSPSSMFSESTFLVASKTFLRLLRVVPDIMFWRALFPGCFAGLLQTVLSGLRGAASTPQSKPEVVCSSLKVLIGLLRLTVGAASSTEVVTTKRTIEGLQRMARSERVSDVMKRRGDQSGILGDSDASNPLKLITQADQNESFLSEINKRLPGPLTVLSKGLRTAQSPMIRKEAVNLYHVILMETRSSWDKDVLQDLCLLSIESCLILSKDCDEDVVASAQSCLEEYRRTARSQNDINHFLAHRLLSMIEELPALAQRHSEAGLINQVKLISAFLALNNNFGTGKRTICKTLQSTLAADAVFLGLRRAVAKLFDVDFSFPFPNQMMSTDVLDNGSLLMDSAYNNGDKGFRLLFLSAASETEVQTLIQALGRTLGPKRTAILVDGVVADLFDDCIGHVAKGSSRTGRSQEAWCHNWVGCLTFVREFLNGAFTSADEQGESNAGKKKKYLKSLATSILPIISSSPLWDLPLDITHVLDRGREIEWSTSRESLSSFDCVSPMALRGNACVMCGLLQVIGAIFGLLDREALTLVPTVLPQLLQKATTAKVACVKVGGLAALENIASFTGFETLGKMIDENMRVVAGSILANLRFPGGRSPFPVQRVSSEIFDGAITLRAVLELVVHGSHQYSKLNPEALTSSPKASFSYVIDMVATLTDRYDFLSFNNRCYSETTLAVVSIFKPAFSFLRLAYQAEEAEPKDLCQRKLLPETRPWLEYFNPFRKLEADNVINGIDESVVIPPREGFDAYRRKQAEEGPIVTARKGEQSTILLSNREIVFTSMLLSRCSFFLSKFSLRLQLESCTAMACGFQFLAAVALLCKDPAESSGTCIRRQVNDSWPSIEARLVSLIKETQHYRITSTVAAKIVGLPADIQDMDVSLNRVFLSKLFDLVVIMVQCSEDFMASRFKNDVFPLLTKVLVDFVQDPSSSDIPSNANHVLVRGSRFQAPGGPRQASETSLIVSMLRCFAGVFEQQKCGLALADLIPTAGNLILPFLGDAGMTGTACMAAFQRMVQIDCDALWRPLVLLSGRQFPPGKPWKTSEERIQSAEVEGLPSLILTQRTQSLVEYINGLSEQRLH